MHRNIGTAAVAFILFIGASGLSLAAETAAPSTTGTPATGNTGTPATGNTGTPATGNTGSTHNPNPNPTGKKD